MKAAAEKKKIKIEKKDTIEDEINEMEKYISYDNIVSNKTISNKTKSNNDVYQVKEKNTSLNETKNLNENKKEKKIKKHKNKEKKDESTNVIMRKNKNKNKKENEGQKTFVGKKTKRKKSPKDISEDNKEIVKNKRRKIDDSFLEYI